MQAAVPPGAGAMAAVLGLQDTDVEALCHRAAEGEVVEAVNFNAPGQVVIAGSAGAVNRAVQLAGEEGGKCRLLPISVRPTLRCSGPRPSSCASGSTAWTSRAR